MPTIQATVENKILTLDDTCVVCNNSDYEIKFTFDNSIKHAPKGLKCRFIVNGIYTDVNVDKETCKVPVIQKATEVKVGLLSNEGNDSMATTYATLKCRHSIVCET